jgi:hypothetical protein
LYALSRLEVIASSTWINALFVSTADLRTKHVNWHLEQLATDGLNNLHSELTVFADIFFVK